MNTRHLFASRVGLWAAAVLAVACQPAAAGDWGCGLKKPKPTGVHNECFGYYPTTWRQWPAECQPCAGPAVTVHESQPATGVAPKTLPAPAAAPAVPPPPEPRP